MNSIQCWEFLEWFSSYELSTRTQSHGAVILFISRIILGDKGFLQWFLVWLYFENRISVENLYSGNELS
jgi:hypothetical protein